MILSRDQLVTLTGRKRKSQQIEWLKRNAVPHFVNAAGWPVVLEMMLYGRSVTLPKLGEVR